MIGGKLFAAACGISALVLWCAIAYGLSHNVLRLMAALSAVVVLASLVPHNWARIKRKRSTDRWWHEINSRAPVDQRSKHVRPVASLQPGLVIERDDEVLIGAMPGVRSDVEDDAAEEARLERQAEREATRPPVDPA